MPIFIVVDAGYRTKVIMGAHTFAGSIRIAHRIGTIISEAVAQVMFAEARGGLRGKERRIEINRKLEFLCQS